MEKFDLIYKIVSLLAALLKIAESRFTAPILRALRAGLHDSILLTSDFLELKLIDVLAMATRCIILFVGLVGGVVTLVVGPFLHSWPECIGSAAFLIGGALYFGNRSNW